ncbi:MAG TPA: glycosyltransferase family 4 protein [Candidatus Acidoferrales bacterium]|nr:glycosyltransferase family 4 protein [Candidatus Acidoferrales bacterium]
MRLSVASDPKYRLAVLNSHPVQYAAPLFRRLAAEPQIDLKVYFCSRQGAEAYVDPGFNHSVKWDVPLLEGYRHEFLPNLRRKDCVAGPLSLINPGICSEIRNNDYDAVWLNGYMYATDWLAFLASRLRGVPVLFLSESSLTYDRAVRRSFAVRWGKPLLLRWLFSQVDGFLSVGTLNSEFYKFYGVSPQRIYSFPHTVDNDFFFRESNRHRAQRDKLRAELGMAANDVVFLFAAKMTPKKGPMELLRAYHEATQDAPTGKVLLMVGDGELKPEAERYQKEHNFGKVIFTGFANQTELPKYYAVSDIFVRPDGIYKGDWGFTVNEAMACGLAVIATDGIGATRDLVRHGDNGLVVKYGDLDALAHAINQLAATPERVSRMGHRSLEIISDWSYEQCVRGLLQALHNLHRETRS